MKLFKKLLNWCYEEKKPTPIEEQKFYIPCKNFFNLTVKENTVKTNNNVLK